MPRVVQAPLPLLLTFLRLVPASLGRGDLLREGSVLLRLYLGVRHDLHAALAEHQLVQQRQLRRVDPLRLPAPARTPQLRHQKLQLLGLDQHRFQRRQQVIEALVGLAFPEQRQSRFPHLTQRHRLALGRCLRRARDQQRVLRRRAHVGRCRDVNGSIRENFLTRATAA